MSAMKANQLVVKIRPVCPADAEAWERLRCDLWPDGREDHAPEIASFFAGTLDEPLAVLLAEDSDGKIVGFAELAIRTELPPLEGNRVGYVEGLYVVPEARGRGVARTLLVASRDWARKQKCVAVASDRAGRVIIDWRFR
jgi:aminoglycoside 6'-N-acetyltransferase I